MTRKLVNIKNLLRIIISLFVISNMVKSCAKALSYEDIQEYISATADYFLDNSNYQIMKSTINKQDLKSYLENNQSILNDYSNVYIEYISRSSYANMYIYIYNGSNYRINTDTIGFDGNYRVMNYSVRNGYMNSSFSGNTSITNTSTILSRCCSTTANYYNSLEGMNYTSDYIEDDYTMMATYVGNQGLGPSFTYYFGNLHTKEITYNGESVLANTLSYNYRLAPIVNVVCEDTIITSMTATLDDLELRCNDLGSYWNLTYNNSTMFKYNQLYNLRVDSVIDGNIETLEAKILFVPPGTIIENNSIISSPSGDFSFNTENATNQIIDNQNQNNNEIINSINNIVGNLPVILSGDSSGDASGDLSSGFDGGGGILGGIFSLFVPDGQFFKDYFEDLNNWFSDRLGLLYFPIELTIDFLTRCLNIDFTTQVLSVGPYVMPLNDNFELVPEIEIDFNSFLGDETVNSIHEIYLFITDGLIIFGLYRLIIKKYNNIVKNKGGG